VLVTAIEPMSLFNEQKTAQAAAFLLHKANGSLPLIKLMKLLYLAERLSFEKYGEPLTGDSLVSMDNGPVLSRTLNHMNGAVRSAQDGWDTWISDRAEHEVALRDPSMVRTPEQDLLALSESDLEVLEQVWQQFGHVGRWKLVELTHDLPEWDDPKGSSKPIDLAKMLQALGYSQDVAKELVQRQAAHRNLGKAFA
jgi:uncharacterized phage-associated protein